MTAPDDFAARAAGLPPGYTMRRSADGHCYVIDDATGTYVADPSRIPSPPVVALFDALAVIYGGERVNEEVGR